MQCLQRFYSNHKLLLFFQIHKLFGCENFCLKFEDDTAVDLDMQLGDSDVIVTVVTASDDDPWCIEGGQLFFT